MSKNSLFLRKDPGKKTNLMNKKGMSISIVLLVILTLVLSVMTIEYFAINQGGTSATLNIPNGLDQVYSDADNFNFYFNGAFQRAASDIGSSAGPQAFIGNLKDELNKTIFYPAGYSYIEYGPLNESSVDITNSEIILNLDVVITNNQNSDSGLGIKYSYVKNFKFKRINS